jgi:two-component system LytT family response regulator
MEKILIKQKTKCIVVSVNEIIYCNSSSNYSTIHLKDQKTITISKCLTQFTKELNGNFLRISQSFLVNLQHIVEINSQNKQIVISTGEALDYTIKFSDLCAALESKFVNKAVVEL